MPDEPVVLEPRDAHDERLLAHVHPAEWAQPEPDGPYNMVVIGAGTAGLVTAAVSAGLGAKVALIERHLMGGDCLNGRCGPETRAVVVYQVLVAAGRAAGRGARGLPEGAPEEGG